jgi:hypothetical protein
LDQETVISAHLRGNLINIDILTDNGRIFATELKDHSLERLPNKCGAGEANLSGG